MKPSSSSSSSSTQHLIDTLTSHIAIYHSHSPNLNPNPNPNPRSAILRWFSSLPTPTRQSILTFTDPKFTQILIQMHSHLARNGPSLFFLLPDLPSDPLCTRRCHGFLARRMGITRPSILSNLLLFGLKDESVLDSVTVGKELVGDVDGFVGLVDAVTNGRFLRGEETGLGEEGKEMGWLKDKGYFSLEEFVANRLEVVLRVSWGKRRGKKGSASEAVGESSFWRRNGCVDWWAGLEIQSKRKFCLGFLGKTAKSLANEIVEGKNTVLRSKNGFFDIEAELPKKYDLSTSWESSKRPILRSDSNVRCDIIPVPGMLSHLAKLLNRLLVLQEISSFVQACQLNKVENETLFFSRLGSVLTVSDCIMRKFRGLIMVVSIDYVSRELLGDVKLSTLPNKSEGKKLNMASQKRKKKSRNSKRENSMPDSSRANSTMPDPIMCNECMNDCATDGTYKLCNQEDNNPIAATFETDKAKACALPKDPDKEHAILLVDSKGPADRKRRSRKGAKHKKSSSKKVSKPEIEINETSVSCISAERNAEETVGLADISIPYAISSDLYVRNSLQPISLSTSCGVSLEPCIVNDNKMSESAQVDHSLLVADNCYAIGCYSGSDKFAVNQSFVKDEKNPQISPCITNGDNVRVKLIDSVVNCIETESSVIDNEHMLQGTRFTNGDTLKPVPSKHVHAAMNRQGVAIQNDGHDLCIHNHTNSIRGTSYEWPNITPPHLTSSNSPHLPAATDRLHLEVGYKQPNHFHHSFVPPGHQARNSLVDGVHGRLVPSLTSPISCDWPPVVKSCGRLNQTVTISYDSAFNPSLPHSYCSGFAAHAALGMQINGASSENDIKHSGDIFDIYDFKTASEFPDDTESYWLSEEETDTHAFSGRDYNQFFGGGVMYWNPAEHVGTGFSRPPSHSSEDSCWAWYEADLNRAIDDMVGMPVLSSSFNTNSLSSPPTASFCSPFDPIGSGHQPIGFTVPGNDCGKVLHSSTSDIPEERSSVSLNNAPVCVEGVEADTLPYTMLRPIIVPRISRKGSRSEFKVNLDHNSPCLPSTRWDYPRIKRPPSPVVLCVPRVPQPPPPSPVGESKKRGFPIARSGSSSPRHWDMNNFYYEDGNMEHPHLCLDGAEVVWSSWGTKGLAGTPVAQSIQGSLLQNHLISISQRACDQEHPDVALPLQPPDLLHCPHKASLSLLHNRLHEEINFFCKKVAAENLIKKPYINWAVKRVTRSLQDLWPRSRTNIFGSNTTGLALPTSDVDLVVSLPPVRNLEPIKEAGILEGRNGIKETCLQHAARYLANQDWVRNDSLKTIENTAIPVIMLMAEVPQYINYSIRNSCVVEVISAQATDIPADATLYSNHSSSEDTALAPCSTMRKDGGVDVKSVRLDISFKSSSHTGLQTSKLVRELTQQFPASVPLALVLKKFLADRSLDHSYSGGLSSYCLVLLITRFLQHEHHIGWPVSQNLGSLLMDFLYFFGNVFDPRQMRISIQGSGVYMKRERGLSIDPIHIDDPLFPSNNVGRNCFRIHQCIKAFADAYSLLENEISQFSDDHGPRLTEPLELLRKIIPNIDRVG